MHSMQKGSRTRTRLPELDSDCPKRLNPTPSAAADSPARALSPVANTRPPQGGSAHTVCTHHIRRASAEKYHFLATFGPCRPPLRNAIPTSFVKSPAPGAVVVSTPSTLFFAAVSESMSEILAWFVCNLATAGPLAKRVGERRSAMADEGEAPPSEGVRVRGPLVLQRVARGGLRASRLARADGLLSAPSCAIPGRVSGARCCLMRGAQLTTTMHLHRCPAVLQRAPRQRLGCL